MRAPLRGFVTSTQAKSRHGHCPIAPLNAISSPRMPIERYAPAKSTATPIAVSRSLSTRADIITSPTLRGNQFFLPTFSQVDLLDRMTGGQAREVSRQIRNDLVQESGHLVVKRGIGKVLFDNLAAMVSTTASLLPLIPGGS